MRAVDRCTGCQSALTPQMRFCGTCGRRVEVVAVDAMAPSSAPGMAAGAAPTAGESTDSAQVGSQEPIAAATGPSRRVSLKSGVFGAAIIVLLVAAGYLVASQGLLTRSDDRTASSDSSPTVTPTQTPTTDPQTSTPSPSAPAEFDPVQSGLCPEPCGEVGAVDFRHERWGPVTLRAYASESPPGPAGVAVLGASGEPLWQLSADPDGGSIYYSWSLADPAMDKNGLIFMNYNPGRYNGVAILRPTSIGIDVMAWPSQPEGVSEETIDLYYAELEGPGTDGTYDIVKFANDCTPSCADGTITSERFRWNGTTFAAAESGGRPRESEEQGIALKYGAIGPVQLPLKAPLARTALVELFGREPDEDSTYPGFCGEILGPDFAVQREIRWGDFSVIGDGPSKDELMIAAWILEGTNTPVPMTLEGGFHFGENIFEVQSTLGGDYDPSLWVLSLEEYMLYGDESDLVSAAGTYLNCE